MDKNSYTHLYLYAKGWYEQDNLIDDMRAILAHRSGVKEKSISAEAIIQVLVNVAWPHIVQNKSRFDEIMRVFAFGDTIMYPDNKLYAAIALLLGVLHFTTTKDLNLGQPDGEVLPVSASRSALERMGYDPKIAYRRKPKK